YKDQPTWVGAVAKIPPAKLEPLQNLPPSQQFLELAKLGNLQQYAAVRGIPVAQSTKCLTDENKVNQLVEMTGNATSEYPEFPGTPTFILNGEMLKVASWKELERQIKTALGG